jgi:predicted nucleic acid-binding protein
MNGPTSAVYVFDTNVIISKDEIKWEAIRIRRAGSPRLKLPDAIVTATAVVLSAYLVTADDKLTKLAWPGFNAVPSLS